MNKKIMILGAGPLQLPTIKKALELGLEVIVADMNPNAVGFKQPRVIKEVISTTDIPNILKAARKHNINGILTVASDLPMPTVAQVCEDMGLNGISYSSAINSTNKAEMRNRLKENYVPIPAFYVVRTWEEMEVAVRKFDSSFVVKASDNSGNRGISLVDNPSDKKKLRIAFDYAKENTRDGRILLEEYMEGPEFSVEGISIDDVYNAIQVTDKITSGPPYFVELGHTQPSAQPKEILNKIISVAEKGVKALGISNGPSHAEIKLTKQGPKIVEIGARLGGGCITSHLVPLSTGIDLSEACIKIALGEECDITPKKNEGAAIRFFQSNPGVFTKVIGLNTVQNKPGFIEVGFFKEIGDYIPSLKTGLDRVGYIITKGENRDIAVENCENAIKDISIVTE